MKKEPEINILVPIYNEQETINDLYNRLTKLMNDSSLHITVILVDDGSTDDTTRLMEEISTKDPRFASIFLSRNYGHQSALTAAFDNIDATQAVFVIDGDLQDPPELLDEFYSYYKQGYDVVYAVRKKRKESFLKRILYRVFYRILHRLSNIHIPLDSGDFSLISVTVIKELNMMREESRFIRGLRSWVGFKQIGLEYERAERKAGDSKYSFNKLLKLALNGIFNFSEIPIKFITIMGLLTIFISVTYLFITIFKLLVYQEVPEGFTGLIFTITLFGGVQLLSIGILGEYIIRIFFQVKERPLYLIKKQIINGKVVL